MEVLKQLETNSVSHSARTNPDRAAFVRLIVLFLVFIFFTLSAQAQPADLPADVRVVIDVSGSMKQNDPNNLRQPALELLVKLLPEGSKAGVWTFGRYINMLVPHRSVDEEWRQLANSKAPEISSTGLYTNIGEALEKASYDLANGNNGYRTSLILLTDGMVDISRDPEENQREWRRIVDEILPRFKNSNFTIHTIALSKNADSELMNKLALSTDGVSSVAESADDLMKIFLAAFDRAAPAEQVPLEDNRFAVDSSVEEFTALIFRKSGSADTRLVSPDKTEYRFNKESQYVNWYRADKYDLITVQRPIEGEWQVLADVDPDSRVTIVSNLNLVVKPIKNNFSINEKGMLSLLLREDGDTITRKEFLQLLDIGYRIARREDGKIWQGTLADSTSTGRVPSNGIFETALNMFDREGYYDIEVLVDGKSFQRQYSHTVSVRESFGVKVEKDIRGSGTHQLIRVSSYGEVDLQNTKVTARIKDPRGRSSIKPFDLTEFDNWLLDLETNIEGEYDVVIRVDAVDPQGGEFEFSPPSITILYPDRDDPFVASSSNAALTAPLDSPVPQPDISVPESEIEFDVADESADEETAVDPEISEPEPPVAEPHVTAEVDSTSAEDDKLWLYIGLGAGNFVILALAFVAYRMIMKNKEGNDLEELEKVVEEAKTETQVKKEVSSAPPSMADMATDDDSDTSSGKLAESLMAEDLDISSNEEEQKVAAKDAPPPLDPGEAPVEEDLGVTDVEFSLDDFSSDDSDDDK